MFDSSSMIKSISALKLIQLLQQLPAGAFVEVNAVGNLKITIGGEYSGFIDLNHEELDVLTQEEREDWN